MYLLTENGAIKRYPYGPDVLRRENQQISFPANMPQELLESFNVFAVKPTDQPSYDTKTHYLQEGAPVLQSEGWVQVWTVVAKTEDEIQEFILQQNLENKRKRQADYQSESDPLFFKYQRGEIEKQVWLDKVEEIRQRYPDVE